MQKGVGFHYGYIPSLVRKEIERAFDIGSLRFIVCTTTLLKGVNLPARNIFMNLSQSWKEDMGPVDFWNLAGRAGRLGREFDGNVFLIDYGEWKPKLFDADRRTPVQPALVRALNRTQDFAAFMTGEPAPHGLSGLFDNSFSKLYRDRYKARLSATLQRMRLDPSAQNIIVQALDRAAEELQLPGVLLDANPWVSPRRQASLLKWMRQKLRDQKNIEDLMPPHPAAADFMDA